MKRAENNGKNYKNVLMIVGVVFLCQLFGLVRASSGQPGYWEQFKSGAQWTADALTGYKNDEPDGLLREQAAKEVAEKRARELEEMLMAEREKVYQYMAQFEKKAGSNIELLKKFVEDERTLRLIAEEGLAACLERERELRIILDKIEVAKKDSRRRNWLRMSKKLLEREQGQQEVAPEVRSVETQTEVFAEPQEAVCDYVQALKEKQVPTFNLSFNPGQYFKTQEFNVSVDRLVFQDQSKVPSNLLDFIITFVNKATGNRYSESDLSDICSQDDLKQWLQSNFKNRPVPQLFYVYSQRDPRSYTGYSNYFVAVKNFLEEYGYQVASYGKQTYSYRAMPTNVADFILKVVEIAN